MYITPAVIFLSSVLIAVYVIIPQISYVSEIKQKIDEKQRQLDSLKTTLNAINTINSSGISDKLSTVNAALPNNKDIIAVYSALNLAARKASVSIRGFTVKVGGVYSQKGVKELTLRGVDQNPSLTLLINTTSSSMGNSLIFSKELYAAFPISEIKNLSSSQNETNYEVNFFYKPYDLSRISKQVTINPLTTSEESILTTIQNFGK